MIAIISVNNLYYFLVFFSFIIFILSLIINILDFNNPLFIKKNYILLLNSLIIGFFVILILLFFCKFFKFYTIYNFFFRDNSFFIFEKFLLKDSLLITCYICSIICIFIMHDKDFFINYKIYLFFSYFLFVTCLLVVTKNLLIIFLCFELLFFPTILYAYKLNYFKGGIISLKKLLYWTLTGSIIILFCIIYLYYNYNSFIYTVLFTKKITNFEKNILFLFIIIGFSIKIPVFPFYGWLINIHVDAPTGFSIFLSGFLVKTAFYCLYIFYNLLYVENLSFFVISFFLLSAFISGLEMFFQVDIKKIVALSTVFEMNIFGIILFSLKNSFSNYIGVFLIIHCLLTALFFYIVEIIQIRFKTRNIYKLVGSINKIPELTKFTWIGLVQIMGIPLTPKFFIEINLMNIFYNYYGYIFILIFTIISFLGCINFIKSFLFLLYGKIEIKSQPILDLTLEEFFILIFIISFLYFFIFLVIFL